MQCLWIAGQLPSLNDLIRAKMVTAPGKGKRWNGYNDLKKKVQTRVAHAVYQQRYQNVAHGYFTYLCVEPHRRRDPSNVLGGAMKCIEDALIECRKLDNDSCDQVLGIAGFVTHDKQAPGVLVIVHPDQLMATPGAALAVHMFR